jgi:hypothetical protein
MFTVTFRAPSIDAYVIRTSAPDGFRALDAARAQIGPQIDYVAQAAYGLCRFEICCDVTEEQARRAFFASGVFGESRTATVLVPAEALNRWVVFSWRLMPGSDTIAECIISCRHSAIVEAWLTAGAPLEWTPEAGTAEAA